MVHYFAFFLILCISGGSQGATSSPQQQKNRDKRFMRSIELLFCFSWHFLVRGSAWKKKPREQGLLEDYSNIQSASFVIAYLDLSAPIFLVNILRKPNLYCSLTRLNFHNPLSTFSLTACFFFFFLFFFFSFSLALGLSSFSFQFRLENKGDCKISVNLIPFKRVFKVNINALRGYCIYYTLLSQLFT